MKSHVILDTEDGLDSVFVLLLLAVVVEFCGAIFSLHVDEWMLCGLRVPPYAQTWSEN